MKATVKPWLYTGKGAKNNGKFPVKLRVTFKREYKFYSLGIDLNEKEFSSYHLNKKLKDFFTEITYYESKAQKIIDDLLEEFTFSVFKDKFYGSITPQFEKKIDDNFWNFSAAHIKMLFKEDRIKSATSFQTSHNKLLKFTNNPSLKLADITPEFIKSFEISMRSKELSKTTISIYTRNLRTLFNEAIGRKIVSQELYPFGKNKYSPPTSKNIKKALQVEDIGKIFSYKPASEIEAWSRDMWLFAYLGNGLNVKDIALLKYKNLVNGEIHFFRAKTKSSNKDNKPIQIILITELKAIIEKWGKLPKQGDQYIFEMITDENASAITIAKDVNQTIKTINKYMERIGRNLKLGRKITTNFARHSYATVLKRAGISIEMISEQLGHASVKTTEIYLDSFEKEQRMELSKHLIAFNKVGEE